MLHQLLTCFTSCDMLYYMLTWGVEHGVKIVTVQFEFFRCRVVQNLEVLHALLAADMLY